MISGSNIILDISCIFLFLLNIGFMLSNAATPKFNSVISSVCSCFVSFGVSSLFCSSFFIFMIANIVITIANIINMYLKQKKENVVFG